MMEIMANIQKRRVWSLEEWGADPTRVITIYNHILCGYKAAIENFQNIIYKELKL